MGRWGGAKPSGESTTGRAATGEAATGEAATGEAATGAAAATGEATSRVTGGEAAGGVSHDSQVPATQAGLVSAHAAIPIGFAERVLVTASGVRQPIVAILLLVAVFTVPSGKPIDGLLLFIVASALAWDAGMSARADAAAAGHPTRAEPARPSAWRLRKGRPRVRHMALGMVAAVIYSLSVGSFSRYSWPATAGVVSLGAGVVIVGWGGRTRHRAIPARFSRSGVVAWGTIFVTGCLWELGALLGQPNFEQSSYAHPTISTLTDPLLASSLGRIVAVLGWVGLGIFLVER